MDGQTRLERPSVAIQITDTVNVFARRELYQRVSLQEESVREEVIHIDCLCLKVTSRE